MIVKNLGQTASWIQRLQEYNFTSATVLMGLIIRTNIMFLDIIHRLVFV
jgi:hypothetical protein